ncbi:MAG TPA: IPT/TIG domain-containing protein [Bryobacteraceae bacterium]|jgi:sugar lactone lactonase YvrE|nr:IPT/TIG domain-containing protein [Bryobacteraceae bacterium]
MATRTEAVQKPRISGVHPNAAIAGGDLQIRGSGFAAGAHPTVSIGEEPAHLVVASDSHIVVRVPETATAGDLIVASGNAQSDVWETHVGIQIADSLHPVANPAIDAEGNIFSTFSGSRGQKSPVSIYKIDTNYSARPFVTDLMNPTGLAFDRAGILYVSSRYDGIIYQVTPTGNMSVYVEGMGVATGMAFDSEENLYVGDRSGTIFKISRSRQIYVFATLEPSIAAYHLAFGPDDYLYVTGPTTSSFDAVHRVAHTGEVEVFYRGLGRPQGLAFDATGRLYVAASFRGSRGIVRLDSAAEPDLFLSGPGIVGLAFTPSRALVLATHNALYRADVGVAGRPLP